MIRQCGTTRERMHCTDATNDLTHSPILTGDHNISLMIQDHYHRNHDGCISSGAINETNGTTIYIWCLSLLWISRCGAAGRRGQTSRSQNERYSVPATFSVARIVYRIVRKVPFRMLTGAIFRPNERSTEAKEHKITHINDQSIKMRYDLLLLKQQALLMP